ncbi:MAG TPA: homoserine dehydrogenase, partial [Pyrinomonadaceae bacterium]|nr:homoserine dehydrogenase [Pyrinomonadaceae bacterium]
DSSRLFNEMGHAVVVLPGFVGRNDAGEINLLGRGGSDYSALFLAHYLKAHCVLVKDVDGLYVNSPSNNGHHGARFAEVSYETAIRLAGSLVQNKAIRFAAQQRLNFTITSIGTKAATQVGSFSDRLDDYAGASRPLKVSLLGCGTVGGGVYLALSELPDLFTIVGVGTRTVERAWRLGVPAKLVTDDLEALVEKPADVVVELIGGTDRAVRLTERALKLGRDVVTANKALIAMAGESLKFLGHTNGASVRYSAAVGGVMPALEAIQRLRAVSAVRGFWGVLNGTTNFILDQLATGHEFDTAVKTAQERGYAEADPRQDLDGIDAAHKIVILGRAAFDLDLPLQTIKCRSLRELKAGEVRNAHGRDQRIRFVASCRRVGNRLEASVEPVELPLSHPLAHVSGTQNRLFIEPEVGEPVTVSGEGAGRWPTSEAVVADLLELKMNLKEKRRRVVV